MLGYPQWCIELLSIQFKAFQRGGVCKVILMEFNVSVFDDYKGVGPEHV